MRAVLALLLAIVVGLLLIELRPATVSEQRTTKLAVGERVIEGELSVVTCDTVHSTILLPIPDTDQQSVLNLHQGEKRHNYQYELVRGEVVYDAEHCLSVSQMPDLAYVVFSYEVTTQGSGVFHYLAVADIQREKVTSEFLGDRIEIDGLAIGYVNPDHFTVSVQLKRHHDEQAMSDAPELDYIKTFVVDSQGIVKPQL